MCNRFIRLKIVQAFNHLHLHLYCLPHNFHSMLEFTSVHLHWLIELPTYVCRFDGKVLNPFFFLRAHKVHNSYIYSFELPACTTTAFNGKSLSLSSSAFLLQFLFTLFNQRLPLITEIKRNSAFFVGKTKKKKTHTSNVLIAFSLFIRIEVAVLMHLKGGKERQRNWSQSERWKWNNYSVIVLSQSCFTLGTSYY